MDSRRTFDNRKTYTFEMPPQLPRGAAIRMDCDPRWQESDHTEGDVRIRLLSADGTQVYAETMAHYTTGPLKEEGGKPVYQWSPNRSPSAIDELVDRIAKGESCIIAEIAEAGLPGDYYEFSPEGKLQQYRMASGRLPAWVATHPVRKGDIVEILGSCVKR